MDWLIILALSAAVFVVTYGMGYYVVEWIVHKKKFSWIPIALFALAVIIFTLYEI